MPSGGQNVLNHYSHRNREKNADPSSAPSSTHLRGSFTREIVREYLRNSAQQAKQKQHQFQITTHSKIPVQPTSSSLSKSQKHPYQWESQALPPGLKICIVGAGMAGLYAALILDSIGIDYDILEASSRPGGRVMTHYFSAAEHDYYDAGAMRFPDVPPMKRWISLEILFDARLLR